MSTTATTVSSKVATHELHITRVFDAPRELVWKVWTDPEHMKHWAGPRQFTASHIENDRRPGGKWRLCLHTDGFDTGDGVLRTFDLCQGGVNREVVEPERLVYTFKWEDNPGLSSNVETVVTVTFEENGGKTTMNFRQAFFVTSGDRDGHVRGWNSCFDKLQDYLDEIPVKERTHGEQ
jgi:uncharacterized protein YndB with AHSA1/START domain